MPDAHAWDRPETAPGDPPAPVRNFRTVLTEDDHVAFVPAEAVDETDPEAWTGWDPEDLPIVAERYLEPADQPDSGEIHE